MAKETKFTKEELEQLEAIKNQYDTITVQLGQLELEQIVLTMSKDSTLASFQELRKQETTLANTFTEKYGKGQLNLKTGVFVSEE